MYIHTIKRAAKRTPAPSLHKDSNLGVPTSPVSFYLGESKGVWFGKRRDADKCDSFLLWSLAVTELDFLVDRIVNIT